MPGGETVDAASDDSRGSGQGQGRSRPLRLLIVSPTALLREGLCALFSAREGIEVVAAVAGAVEAISLLNDGAWSPDLLLADLGQPIGSVSLAALVDASKPFRIVAINVPLSDGEVMACIEQGVVSLVTCEASMDDLVESLEAAMRGELLCRPAVATVLLSRLRQLAAGSGGQDEAGPLTAREEEIVGLVGEGLSNKEIAQRLTIAVPTVRNHIHNILTKLGVHSRRDAALLMRRSVISPQ